MRGKEGGGGGTREDERKLEGTGKNQCAGPRQTRYSEYGCIYKCESRWGWRNFTARRRGYFRRWRKTPVISRIILPSASARGARLRPILHTFFSRRDCRALIYPEFLNFLGTYFIKYCHCNLISEELFNSGIWKANDDVFAKFVMGAGAGFVRSLLLANCFLFCFNGAIVFWFNRLRLLTNRISYQRECLISASFSGNVSGNTDYSHFFIRMRRRMISEVLFKNLKINGFWERFFFLFDFRILWN